jgi:hypothetical protein
MNCEEILEDVIAFCKKEIEELEERQMSRTQPVMTVVALAAGFETRTRTS